MKRTTQNSLKVFVFVLIAFFAVMICVTPAPAGDQTMQTNLKEVADQLARWSKQSSMGKMTPEAQVKLSELLLETSQLLKQMSMKGSSDMQMEMEHHDKIQMMKKAWDPFDTTDRM